MEVMKITDREIVERLENKLAQKKFFIKRKYRKDEDEEDEGIFDKEGYLNRPKRYGEGRLIS